MINIILVGACGRMGRAIARVVVNSSQYRLVWAKEAAGHQRIRTMIASEVMVRRGFPEHVKPNSVIVDFSSPQGTVEAVNFAKERNIPLVSGTTGLRESEVKLIHSASSSLPVFYSANMSLGVAVLSRLVKECATVLKGKANAEIVEYHHTGKIDSPSGTALSLAGTIKEAFGDALFVFGRHGRTGPRKKEEIGIHAIRAGGIVGKHDVLFGLPEEVILLSHTALSRDAFARGALEAAKFIVGKEPGYYTMSDLLEERIAHCGSSTAR